MKYKFPPVSCPVLAFNAESFILETFESIYNQNYEEIELIFSDDYSSDNTVEIAKKWLAQERVKNRFTNIQILTVEQNQGVSANMNRSIKASTFDWIKIIAADDILLPDCLKDNFDFINENPEIKVVFSQVKLYQDVFRESNFTMLIPDVYPDNLMKNEFSAKDQWKILLEGDRINNTPSFFFHREIMEIVGYYDESNRLVEDAPMWLKMTQFGIKLYYFHKPTIGYRIHSKASNNVGDGVLIQPSLLKGYEVRKKLAHPYLPITKVWKEKSVIFLSKVFVTLGLNEKTNRNQILYRITTVYLNPFHYLESISRRFHLLMSLILTKIRF
jgi:glycosyltransferase involved in cell wall biosynthesis